MKNTKEKWFIEKTSIKKEFTGSSKCWDFIQFIEDGISKNHRYSSYLIALGELDYRFNLNYQDCLSTNEEVKLVIFDDISCMCGRAGVAILDINDDSVIMDKIMWRA